MKSKKFWIGIGALAVFLVVVFFYLDYRNKSLSPSGTATLTSAGMTVTVNYSRPSVRGRVIFGDESQNALQPYGKYWRLGANESTEVTLTRDVKFNGQALKAGTYRLYAVPGPQTFEIGVNTELGNWGAWEPDYDKDILKTKVPVEKLSNPVEQYTITLAPEGNGINMIFEWADTRFIVPLMPQ